MSVVVPSEIGDQTETAGEAGHEPLTRTRAAAAMPLASAAYIGCVIGCVPLLVDIRGFIRTCPGSRVK